MRWGIGAALTLAVIGGGCSPAGPGATPLQLPGSVPVATRAAAPPARPSGRFLPTWLPGTLRIQTEDEWTAGGPAVGWARTYIRRGPFPADQDVLTISLEEGAPALDVDLEVARSAGARQVAVQGRPALFLGLVAARHDAALVWSPGPGRLAQVLGSGVSEEELADVAEGFQPPPRLDATPVPDGFAEMQRSDVRPYPAAVPRQYTLGTLPPRGPSRSEGTPSVLITAGWGRAIPTGSTTVAIRDRSAVVTVDGRETVVTWSERAELVVSVAGRNVALDEVRRVAEGLREQSMEEVEARLTGRRVVVDRGELGGVPYQLRTYGGSSGPCLELVRDWVGSACSGDPLRDVVEFEPSNLQGVMFGSVLREAASVRLELDAGQTVETPAVGRTAGLPTAFYVVAVPAGVTRVRFVVALGAGGEELRRTPVD